MAIETTTFTSGAPPKTSGITKFGTPPDLNAQMMQTAPSAPSAPPTVDQTEPPALKPLSPPCDDSPTTGTRTPIRK